MEQRSKSSRCLTHAARWRESVTVFLLDYDSILQFTVCQMCLSHTRHECQNSGRIVFIYFQMYSVIGLKLRFTCAYPYIETKACLSQSQLKGHLSHERHFVLNTEERISIRLSSPHKGVCVKMQSGTPLEKKKKLYLNA